MDPEGRAVKISSGKRSAACEELERLSLDRQKRLEYETRQKNIRDYNSQMKSI